jgi:hypothetical protein
VWHFFEVQTENINTVLKNFYFKWLKIAKAVQLHAPKALGGEEV